MLEAKNIVLMGCEWYPTDTNLSKGIFFRNHAEAIAQAESVSKVKYYACHFL